MLPLAAVAGLLVTAAAGIAVRAWRLHHRRERTLEEFAAESGFDYASSDQSLVRRWVGAPFGVGDNRQARKALIGQHAGQDFIAFEYSYGSYRQPTERFCVVGIRLPAELPRLEVTDRRPSDSVLNLLGVDQIEVESEQFNREFTVLTAAEGYGHAVIHPRMMAFLLARSDLPWRIEGADLLCWSPGRLEPDSVLPRVDFLAELAGLVPAFVWADYGHDPRNG